METAPAPAPQNNVWTVLKSVAPATWLGAACTVAFLVFCQFDNTVIRWWLMLPLAALGSALLLWRRKRAPAGEARVCAVLLGLLLALVVLRDIGLSRKLAGLFDKIEGYKTQFHQATSEFQRFFEGTR